MVPLGLIVLALGSDTGPDLLFECNRFDGHAGRKNLGSYILPIDAGHHAVVCLRYISCTVDSSIGENSSSVTDTFLARAFWMMPSAFLPPLTSNTTSC